MQISRQANICREFIRDDESQGMAGIFISGNGRGTTVCDPEWPKDEAQCAGTSRNQLGPMGYYDKWFGANACVVGCGDDASALLLAECREESDFDHPTLLHSGYRET